MSSFSRRSFLQSAGIVAAGGLVPTVPVLAQPENSAGALPAPIARLKSRRSEARPITLEERQQRIEKARRLMAENKLDAILMSGGTSLIYFSGIRWWLSERLFAMVLPVKGNPFYVCPAFEEDRAREQISGGPGGNDPELRLWQEDENPYQRVAEGLKDRGIVSGRLGMEETVRYVYDEGIAKAAPAIQIASATPVTAGCRMFKSPHELQLMTLANQVTLAAYEAAYLSTREGMTQHDFMRLIETAHTQQGFQGGASVQVGEYSALPHGSARPQVIREGTILLMDGGCKVEEYESDISRTVVLGQPSEKMKQVFDIVHKAQ